LPEEREKEAKKTEREMDGKVRKMYFVTVKLCLLLFLPV
jgi:hypothetical protein